MALHPSGPDHTPPPYLNKSARFREHVENRYQIDDRQDELQAAFQELSQLRAVEGTDDNLAQQLDKSIISFLTRTEILKSETDRFKPDFAEVEKLLKIKRPVEEPGDKGKADGQPPRVCASALVDVLMFFFSRTLDPVHFKTSQSFDLSLLYDNYHVKSDEGGLKKMDFQTFKFAQRTEALPQTVIAILYCFLLNHHRLEDGLRANEPDTRLKEDRMWAFNKASNINQLQFHNILIEDVLHGLSGLPLVGSLAKLDIDTKIEGDITGSYRREDSARLIYRLLSIPVDDPKASDDAQASTSSKSSNGPQTSSSSKSSSSPQASGSSKPLNGPQAPVDNQVADTPSNEARHILRESLQQPTKGCAPIAGAPSTILTWSRNCPLPTFNDYRRSLGLNSISSFSTWTDIREVEELASKLYMNNMEKLELLPGLLFERRFSGSGFGLGYTHTYALLADIVKTLRQDPIRAKLAKDELTPWGFEEAKPFPRKNAYEGQLCRLLLINIPTLSTATNAYTHFPLSSIANTKDRLDQLKLTEKYDMFFPSDETPYELKTLPLIAHVFNSPLEFNTLYGSELKRLTKGYGFMLGFDDDPKPDEDKPTHHDLDVYMTCYALMPDVRAYKEYATYLQAQVVKHLKKVVDDRETYKEVDIAKHVIIPACTQWAREKIYGIPDEKLTDEQLEKHFEEFLNIFSVVFNKVPAAQQHTASAKALETSSELFKVIEKKLKERADKLKKNEENPIEFIMRVAKEYYTGRHLPPSNKHSFLDQLIQSNHSSVGRFPLVTTFDSMKDFLTDANGQPKENGRKELEQARLASNTMALAVVAAVNYAQACINILEYILQYHPNRLEELRKLAEKGGKESNEQIMAYCHEALRLHQPLFLYRRAAKEVTLEVPGKGDVVIKKGTVVYANLWSVHQALGEAVELDRGLEGEVHSLYGVGYHRCPAANFVKKTMPEFLRPIFKLNALQLDHYRRREPPIEEKLNCYPIDGPKGVEDEKGKGTTEKPVLFQRIYTDGTKSMAFPFTLPVTFDRTSFVMPKDDKPQIDTFKTKVTESGIVVAILTFLLTCLFKYFTRGAVPLDVRTITSSGLVCHAPTAVIQKWAINTFLPDADGRPAPVEYTLNHHKPHRLSLIDIDHRDMMMAVHVDNVLRGQTTDFAIDTNMDCGEDIATCLQLNFSGGVVVVPPGDHTVKITWVGKEFTPGTNEMNWGGDYSRRFKWQIEGCS